MMKSCFYTGRAVFCLIPAKRLPAALLLLLLLFSVAPLLFAQNQRQIRGTVADEKGTPLADVSIVEKGTRHGVRSQEDGRFELTVSGSNPILIVTHTGFQPTEVTAGRQSLLSIALQSYNRSLDEVVVVGYGSQKKTTLTGAVATVKGTALVQSSSANVANAIAGRIPGVIANNRSGRPGDDGSSLFIRGFNSFGGGTSPLIVVDGVPDRDFSRLNPNDIESITVLKDASAAIYGVRAANGAILVTTKRGKSGKPTIQYDGSYGIQQLTRLPKIVNAWEYMAYYNEINPGTYQQSEIDKYKAGNDPNYTSTDWIHEVFRKTAPQQTHSLSVSGGTDNVKYYFSGQLVDQSSNFRNSIEHYRQYNFRSNIDARISKNLKVNLDVAGRLEDRTYPTWSVGNILHETRSMYPFIPTHWPNGSPSAGVTAGRNPVILVTGDPGYDKIKNYVLTPLAGFEWKLPFVTEGLSLSGYASYDVNMRHEKIFTKPWDAYSYNKTTGVYSNVRTSTAISSVTQNEGMYNGSTRFIKLVYDRQFGRHNINAFAGYEATSTTNWGTYAYRKNLLSDQIDQIFTGSAEGQVATGSAAQDGRASYLGRVAYDYSNKYIAEVTMRYNGSFNFPEDKRWGLFPSVSAGWRISEEPFFKQTVPFIDQLKLRASWGILGSDAVAQYLFLTRYQLITNTSYQTYFGDYGLANALYLSSTPNPDITWEKQDTRNIGLDLGLLNNKLNITADYFRYLRSDILAARNASIPLYTGMSLPSENIGKSLNSGVDFSIGYNDAAGDLKYTIGINGTFAKSKVIFSDEAATVPEWQKFEGHPINSWLLFASDGIYRTQDEIDHSIHVPGARVGEIRIKDTNGDGSITFDDAVRTYESAVPQIVYGCALGLNYRGIGLNILLSGQAKARQLINSQMQGSLIAPPQWLYDGRWTTDNTNSIYPRAFNDNSTNAYYYNNSNFWLMNAAFLRLKTLELSYSIPSQVYNRLGLSSVRVYAAGYNLLSFDHLKKYGVDPETNNTTGVNYPQSRIVRFGVNIGL
ncbi:TonB-dependent receptor [Niabella pedocola]|uniref:TonB-dependent receptor n=1 Tax=Niabella pedocola TaxID=1752077 RepID=A0ABS8PNG4_9BACT|nr:TonB-dependent receptor [Niabella pedocola]MCD2421832.1 TonB-dependent receptor [Niabella pedocola]